MSVHSKLHVFLFIFICESIEAIFKKNPLANIDKHISNLLHENDCVIVPNMGGFLNAHSQNGIDSSQYSATKLSAKISFNVLLNHNDGLLANYLVKHEKLTYNEALEEIEKFVGEFNHELNSGKKFIIERVGVLYKDDKRNIQIEPYENRSEVKESIEVSGLPLPLLQNDFIRKTEDKSEVTVLPVVPELHQRKSLVFKRSIVIIFSLLLTGSFLAYFLSVYFSPSSELNSVLPDSNTPLENRQPVDLNASKSGSVVPVSASDANQKIVNGVSVHEKGSELSNSSTRPVDAAANLPANKFYIVAGSFRSIDNANRKLNELKLHGFKNAQMFSDSRKLYLVYYDRFNTFETANENMISIRTQYKEAWIYSR